MWMFRGLQGMGWEKDTRSGEELWKWMRQSYKDGGRGR